MDELIACKACGKIHRVEPLDSGAIARCVRCGVTIARGAGNLQFTAAFSLAALFLYFPANVFPILRLNMHGAVSENTVLQGCIRFYQHGDPGIALIVFLASVLIPLLKLLSLVFLVISTEFGLNQWRRPRTWVFRFVDSIGRWAMLDVFVVAILISLVKLESMATIFPGPGLFAFGCVVVLTLLASSSFDSKLIWESAKRGSAHVQ